MSRSVFRDRTTDLLALLGEGDVPSRRSRRDARRERRRRREAGLRVRRATTRARAHVRVRPHGARVRAPRRVRRRSLRARRQTPGSNGDRPGGSRVFIFRVGADAAPRRAPRDDTHARDLGRDVHRVHLRRRLGVDQRKPHSALKPRVRHLVPHAEEVRRPDAAREVAAAAAAHAAARLGEERLELDVFQEKVGGAFLLVSHLLDLLDLLRRVFRAGGRFSRRARARKGRRAEIRPRRPRRRRRRAAPGGLAGAGVFFLRVAAKKERTPRVSAGRRRHEIGVQAFGSQDRPVHDLPALGHAQPGERGASRAVDLRPTRDAPVPQRGVRRGLPPASRLGRGLVAFGRGPRRRRRGRRRAQRRRGHGARAGGSRGSRSRGRPPRGSVAFAARRPDPDRATMAVKDESTPPPRAL